MIQGSILHGVKGQIVTVETTIDTWESNGFSITGLPSREIRECKNRIMSALHTVGFDWPAGKIKVNLAPAWIPKTGTSLDLPIALSIMAASGSVKIRSDICFIGELAIDGTIRACQNVFQLAMADAKYVLVPAVSARDVQLLASRKTIVCCETLAETVKAIKTSKALPKIETQDIAPSNGFCDLAEVSGQNEAKEALEISAVGGLNLLLMGPPGMGKTMLARCMPGIVPPLEENEQIEITGIWSLRGLIERNQYVKYRPFREVHHTISREGLVGGGTRGQIRPGEISLAHKGFLLLDEILEFPRNVIESIRQPLEDGFISIGRSGETVKLPCQFTLLGTANPCPCGWSGTYICNSCGMTKLRMCCSEKTVHKCKCQQKQIAKYLMKLSGPIIDRIDMKVIVEPFNEKLIERQSNGTAQVRERIMKARERAKELTGCEIGKCNVMKIVKLDAESRRKIGAVMQSISARGATKIMKIAMSICCLKGENMVKWWMVEQAQKLFLGK